MEKILVEFGGTKFEGPFVVSPGAKDWHIATVRDVHANRFVCETKDRQMAEVICNLLNDKFCDLSGTARQSNKD